MFDISPRIPKRLSLYEMYFLSSALCGGGGKMVRELKMQQKNVYMQTDSTRVGVASDWSDSTEDTQSSSPKEKANVWKECKGRKVVGRELYPTQSSLLYSNSGSCSPGSSTATGGKWPASPSHYCERNIQRNCLNHTVPTTTRFIYYLRPLRFPLALLPSFLLLILPIFLSTYWSLRNSPPYSE